MLDNMHAATIFYLGFWAGATSFSIIVVGCLAWLSIRGQGKRNHKNDQTSPTDKVDEKP